MTELESANLNPEEKQAFELVAKTMLRLETELPGTVFYDTLENEYLSCKETAERLQRIARSDPKPKRPEIPACAAIRYTITSADDLEEHDVLIAGYRHGGCILEARILGISRNCSEQGFMTTHGRFVDRKEARKLMDAAGLPSAAPDGFRGDLLFSEDLY